MTVASQPFEARDQHDLVLPQLLHARGVSADGDAPFVCEIGGEWLSYAQVDLAARAWAGRLQSLGVKAGDRVAVLAPTGVEAFVIWIGCGWLRALEVPVHAQYQGAILSHLINK